jgi:hypothetical protein
LSFRSAAKESAVAVVVACPDDGPTRHESMAVMEDQLEKTKERQERIFNGGFTGGEWIGVLAASLALTIRSSTRYGVSLISDPAQWLGKYLGSLLLVVVVWLIARAIYRRITEKKPAGE